MTDDKPKHKPQQKHTLSEVLKSLQDLIRTDLIPAKTPPSPAPSAEPPPSPAEADSFNEALDQLDQIITQRIIEPVERAREQPPEPLLPDETLEIEWNDGAAAATGASDEAPAASAEPETELQPLEEEVEPRPVSADAEGLSEQGRETAGRDSELQLADIASTETLESIIEEASAAEPAGAEIESAPEPDVGAAGGFTETELEAVELKDIELDVHPSDAASSLAEPAASAPPPGDTEGQQEFSFAEPTPGAREPALAENENAPAQEPPTLILATEPETNASDKSSKAEDHIADAGEVPPDVADDSILANDSISIDLSDEPGSEPQPQRDAYVVEFENPRATAGAPPPTKETPAAGAPSNLLEESIVNMKSPPEGAVPPSRTGPDKGGAPAERAPRDAANAPKENAGAALVPGERNSIPVLKDVADLAAPPAPPLPDAAQARDIAIRVIARLNIERRKAGEPQLDIKTIDRLQQYLADALTKRALNKPK